VERITYLLKNIKTQYWVKSIQLCTRCLEQSIRKDKHLVLSFEEQSFLQKASLNMRKVWLLFHVFVKGKEGNVFVTKTEDKSLRIIAVHADRKGGIS